MHQAEVIVIGGGLVGLATAREALKRGRSVVLVEKENNVAAHQSGHNSGVIHSGVYYQPNSLKAQLGVRGAALMKAYCEEWRVPLRRVGKLIVAKDDHETPRLATLLERARANGAGPAALLQPAAVHDIAPHVSARAALWLPEVAITDFAQVAARVADDIEGRGGTILLGTTVHQLIEESDGLRVLTSRGDLRARQGINCGGLHSDRLARVAGSREEVRIVPFRGEYYLLGEAAAAQVPCLVYPVPDERFPFLGVHLTPMVGGGVEAGPNAVPALAREGYRWRDVSANDLLETLSWPGFWRFAARHWRMGIGEIARSLSRERFLQSLRNLMPSLQKEDLMKGGSGVRAQAMQRDGALVDDFRMVRRGRLLNVVNAPSPAATAALAIGAYILDQLGPNAQTS